MLTKYILSATNIVPSKVFTTEYILLTTRYILLPTEYNLVVYQVYLVAHQVRLKLPTGTRTARQHRGLSGESSNILLHWYPFLINNSTIPSVVKNPSLPMLVRYLTTRCTAWTTSATPDLGSWVLPLGSIIENYVSLLMYWFQIDPYVYLTSN